MEHKRTNLGKRRRGPMRPRGSAIAAISCCFVMEILGANCFGVNASAHSSLSLDVEHCTAVAVAPFLPLESTCTSRDNALPAAATVTKTPSRHEESDWLAIMAKQYAPQIELPNYTLPDVLNQPTDWTEIGASFRASVVATCDAITKWVYFVRLLAIPILAVLFVMLEAMMPHTQTAAVAAYHAFQSLDPPLKVAIGTSLVLVLVAWRQGYFYTAKLAWKRLRLRCHVAQRAFRQQLATKSQTAALILPHLVYAGVCYLVVAFSPDAVLQALSHDMLLAWLSTFYPMYQSIRAVKLRRHTDQPADEFFERSLKYWILWGYFHASVTALSLFVPQFIVTGLRPSTLYLNLFLNWLHNMKGTHALYRLAINYLHPYAHRTTAATVTATQEQSNVVLRALAAVGIVSTRTADLLRDLASQGPALAGLLFLVTPGFLTNAGCDAVALAFPAYVAMGTLAAGQRRTHEWWVVYFTVTALFEYWFDSLSGILLWIPFVYHLKLVVMMWLQFPYFRGAQRLFDVCFNNILIDPRRRRASSLDTRVVQADVLPSAPSPRSEGAAS
ncbi:Aste57867_13287 [Aphanomyces stellatus]|uniref:Aste57867_13287 protein n=1 Tax=Aphanomyces stellatus TaxID=120398 RepID=A0A485KY06_9STRA|nr:hypothetical protein As57867_013238 [Aphanomyces stellatus]VFT90126.1 Aste57867_13287 [Aphanomyces stellatus]